MTPLPRVFVQVRHLQHHQWLLHHRRTSLKQLCVVATLNTWGWMLINGFCRVWEFGIIFVDDVLELSNFHSFWRSALIHTMTQSFLSPFSVSLVALVTLVALVAWVGSRELSAKFCRSLQAPHDPASWLRYGAAEFGRFGLFLEAASVLSATLKGGHWVLYRFCIVGWCIGAWHGGIPSSLANLSRRRFSFLTKLCPVHQSYQNSLKQRLVYTWYTWTSIFNSSMSDQIYFEHLSYISFVQPWAWCFLSSYVTPRQVLLLPSSPQLHLLRLLQGHTRTVPVVTTRCIQKYSDSDLSIVIPKIILQNPCASQCHKSLHVYFFCWYWRLFAPNLGARWLSFLRTQSWNSLWAMRSQQTKIYKSALWKKTPRQSFA